MNTENIEYIETILTIIIVFLQVVIFSITLRQIRIFKRAVPDLSKIKTENVSVPIAEISNLSSRSLSSKIKEYKKLDVSVEDKSFFRALLISSDDKGNEVFDNILSSINTYLLRNRTSVPDFNLIKDITERNTDAIEEEINLTISIPLYLGLMGTMLGIVVGLFNMPDFTGSGTNEQLGEGISLLLGGVKIAMVASLVGLLLTTFNSGVFLKGSKGQIDRRKNEFYSFVQTEFLPVINQSLGSTFDTLQKNLSKFNREFAWNLGELSKTFKIPLEALSVQKEIFAEMQKLDLVALAKYNIEVYESLKTSTKEFERFNVHIANIGSVLDNSKEMVNGINALLGRTNNFNDIAVNLDNRLAQSKYLLDFLYHHFKELEDLKSKTISSVNEVKKHTTETIETVGKSAAESIESITKNTAESMQGVKKDFTESIEGLRKNTAESIEGIGKDTTGSIEVIKQQVSETGFSIKDAFEELAKLIHSYDQRMKEFTVKEADQLERALTESRTGLGNLHHLEVMKDDLSQFKDSAASQGENIRKLMEQLSSNSNRTNSLLKTIEQNSIRPLLPEEKGFMDYVKKLFKQKDQ